MLDSIERETKLMPTVDLGQQYYICCPGYLGDGTRPDPLQFLYGNVRLTIFNLECAPPWLFYIWICSLARRAGVFHLFTEEITREGCADHWHAISILINLCAMRSSSLLIMDEIYQNREQALERMNAQ